MEIRKEFRRPTENSRTTSQLVAEEFDQFLTRIQRYFPSGGGREQALVIAKLQEAEAWAQRLLIVNETAVPKEG